jgi:hypothetical protein
MARPALPASKAAAGSPSHIIARFPGFIMLTSSSGRPRRPAVAVGTDGTGIRLHNARRKQGEICDAAFPVGVTRTRLGWAA